MIAFLYDMIYTIPLALSSVILLHDFLGAGSMHAAFAAIICCILLILFRHLQVRGRIVLGGGLGALLAGAAVVGKTELLKSRRLPMRFLCWLPAMRSQGSRQEQRH